MLILEKNITRKKLVNELLELKLELNIGENTDYKVETIKNNTVYINKAEKKPITNIILSDIMERLLRWWEKLRANLSSHISLKDDQYYS